MGAVRVFIDTSALLALLNADDALHGVATEAYAALSAGRAGLVTSQWVLAEFLNGASRPPMRGAAIALLGALRASPRASILAASAEDWERAHRLYADRPDKSWSFVDCASILACQDLGIERVLTRDRHFEQAGLSVLLK